MKNDSDNSISKLLPLSSKVLEGIFNMAACLPEEDQQHLALYFQIVVKEQQVLEELRAFIEGDPAFLGKFKSLVSCMNQASSFPAEQRSFASDLENIRQNILSGEEKDLPRQQEELFLALKVFSECEWFRLDKQAVNDPSKIEILNQMVEKALAEAKTGKDTVEYGTGRYKKFFEKFEEGPAVKSRV